MVVVEGGEGLGLELWTGGGVLNTSDDAVSGSRIEEKPLPPSREGVNRSCITMVVVGLGWAKGSKEAVGATLVSLLSLLP